LEAFDGTKIASEKTCELAKIYNGVNLDDKGLELAKEKNIFSAHAIECINKEFQDSGSFAPINFDVAFTGELKLHLGGITCIVNEIINPHREDGTIVYVPEEKTLFLGDAAYGRSKNGRNYYDREKTSALLQEVDTYDAEYYLCSHESICDKEEMQSYWNDLNMGLAMTKGCSSIEEAITNFEKHYNKNPSKNDLFFLESFMD
jgi:flavorubredoxin